MATLTRAFETSWADRLFRGSDKLWLRDQGFDLSLISLSAAVAVVPILLYYVLRHSGMAEGTAEDAVTVVVMVLVGGPHVFTTYTRTYFERDFVRRRPFWFWASFIVLFGVPLMALYSDYTRSLLMTGFFFAASLHILHQISYVMRCYNEKAREAEPERATAPRWHTLVEYSLVLSSLYPVANYRMVEGTFRIGRVDPNPFMPGFTMHPWFWMLPAFIFGASLILFAIKTRWEIRNNQLHRPKFALIAITAFLGIAIPSFPNLDSSFQGYNAWHSLQYLGLTWYINVLRYDRGEISNSWVRSFCGVKNKAKFYSAALGATLTLVAAVIAVAWASGYVAPDANIDILKSYNAIAMSFLLVHYFHDFHFFNGRGTAKLAAAGEA
jgi:hypothetical protein